MTRRQRKRRNKRAQLAHEIMMARHAIERGVKAPRRLINADAMIQQLGQQIAATRAKMIANAIMASNPMLPLLVSGQKKTVRFRRWPFK